jgi:hypothetical protein
MKYFFMVAAFLISACGSGGGGQAFDDGTAEFQQKLPCGDFNVEWVDTAPGIRQCIHRSGNSEEIVIYCTDRSECVAACEQAASRCG